MHEVVLIAVSAAVSIETILHILATCFIITTCQVFFQVMPATVNANGSFLAPPQLEVAICDFKLFHSSLVS